LYLTEVSFAAKAIEGVSTSTAGLSGTSERDLPLPSPSAGSPAWTDANQSDVGVTLLQLFSWADDALAYRNASKLEHLVRHPAFAGGIVSGLGVEGDHGPRLKVLPGLALDPVGRPIQTQIVSAQPVIDRDP
jgi:hypothetical protein